MATMLATGGQYRRLAFVGYSLLTTPMGGLELRVQFTDEQGQMQGMRRPVGMELLEELEQAMFVESTRVFCLGAEREARAGRVTA